VNALQGKSADQVLRSALSAGTRLGAVHYVLQTTKGAAQLTVTGDASASEGAQYIVSGTDQTILQLIGNTLYVRGNTGGLQDTVGMSAASASQFDGKWMAAHVGDPLFLQLAPELVLKSVMAHLTPAGTLAESTPGLVNGHEVIGVRGNAPLVAQAGSATLWVTTAPPTVPIGTSTQTTDKGTAVTQVGTFSRWGEHVDLKAPSGSVPFPSGGGK